MTSKIGVMVIHGIGDPAPGEPLRSLTDALSNQPVAVAPKASFAFEPVEEKRLALQATNKRWLPSFFPMFLRRCVAHQANKPDAAAEMIFAEVFWGSASQLPTGTWGIVQGLARLFFRSTEIVRLAADETFASSPHLTWLRRSFFSAAYATSYLLTAPILALNVLLLLDTLVYLGLSPSSFTLFEAHLPRAVMLDVVLALVTSVVLLGWHYLGSRNTLIQHLVAGAWWLLGIVLLWWLWYKASGQTQVEKVYMPLVQALLIVFLCVTLGLVVMIVVRGIHWAIVRGFLAKAKPEGPPLTIALFTMIVQCGLWVVVIPTLWTIFLNASGQAEKLKDFYNKSVLVNGGQWLVLGSVLIFGALVWGVRAWRTRRLLSAPPYGSGPTAQGTWRLIVNPFLIGPVAVVTLIFLVLILFVGVLNLLERPQPVFIQSIRQMLANYPLTSWAANLALLIMPLFISPLRLALDLVNDIINYSDDFDEHEYATLSADYLPSNKANAASLQDERPADGIRPRFRRVLDYLVATEQVTHLVIIAHSLGSIIVLDELARSAKQGDQLARATSHALDARYQGKITLFTMGSPIAHLYQHYFPGFYPSWHNTNRWRLLFKRVRYWRHYYRIDDYVGMELESIPFTLTDFAQFGIGEGGHTEYFQDDRFVEKLYPELLRVLAHNA